MHMSQGCAEWRDDLGVYILGALDRVERAAMRQHLAVCAACRTEYEDLIPVRDWLAETKRHLTTCPACLGLDGYRDAGLTPPGSA
jgi:hypothetical protein